LNVNIDFKNDHHPNNIINLIENEYDNNPIYKKLVDYGYVILTQIILKCLSWKAGIAFYSLRKSALLVLKTLSRYGVICHLNIKNEYKNAENKQTIVLYELYNMVAVSLDEDYGFDARILALESLKQLFYNIILSYEDAYQIYDKLLKRLDDSNDAVRIEAAQTLKLLFLSSRNNFVSSPLE